MSGVRRFVLWVLLLLSFFCLVGQEKMPPLPLAELQNPKGPSYVPIPYPKTREEIIADLEYVIRKDYIDQKGVRYYGAAGKGHEILPQLLEEPSPLRVGTIVRATSKSLARSKEYILIDLLDTAGEVAARVSLEDCGLYAGAAFPLWRKQIPLMSLQDTKNFLSRRNIPSLKVSEVREIEYMCFIGNSPTSPYLKIKTKNKIYYMNSRDEIFRFKHKEKYYTKHPKMLPRHLFDKSAYPRLIDPLQSEVIYLERVK